MDRVNPSNMREIIERLIEKHGGLREAARAHNTTHRKLGYLRDAATKDLELFDLLESIRKDLKISKSAFWDDLRKRKKDKG